VGRWSIGQIRRAEATVLLSWQRQLRVISGRDDPSSFTAAFEGKAVAKSGKADISLCMSAFGRFMSAVTLKADVTDHRR